MLHGANGTIPGHCGEASEVRTGAAVDGTGLMGVTFPTVFARSGWVMDGEERAVTGAGSGGQGAGLKEPTVAAVDRSD